MPIFWSRLVRLVEVIIQASYRRIETGPGVYGDDGPPKADSTFYQMARIIMMTRRIPGNLPPKGFP
jgi:hypothetical protein